MQPNASFNEALTANEMLYTFRGRHASWIHFPEAYSLLTFYSVVYSTKEVSGKVETPGRRGEPVKEVGGALVILPSTSITLLK